MEESGRSMTKELAGVAFDRIADSLVATRPVREVLRRLVRENERGETPLSRLFHAYAQGGIPGKRLRYMLPFAALDLGNRLSGITREYAVEKMYGRDFVSRSIIHAVRSVAELGISKPQRFVSPVLVVWNFTQRCDLTCSHSDQNAGKLVRDELSLEERLDLVGQLADLKVPLVALSGGEPMMGAHFWEVVEYMGKEVFHISLATNATLIDREAAARLAACGVDYVQVSLDSAVAERHNAFRGADCWDRAIAGIRNAVSQEGIEVGVAATMTRDNLDELEDLIRLSIDLGCDYFHTYNFIPVGRGRALVERDLTPEQRERMFDICYRYFGEIDFGSTAPQMIRRCMELAGPEGKMLTSHPAAEMGGRFGRNFGVIFGGCGCGRTYCTVQPDGTVTPCVYMPLQVGDLRKERLADIWKGSEVFEAFRDRSELTGHCYGCAYMQHCGGCRARAYAYFGDHQAGDPGCKFNQDLWEELIAENALDPAPGVHNNLAAAEPPLK